MKRVVLLFALLSLVAATARAAGDPVQKAMKTYEKHRYGDAGRDLRAALPSLDGTKRSSAYLTLGMIYLKNAGLHADLADLSATVSADYLKRLARERGRSRSRYSRLYLGLALLAGGAPKSAETELRRFVASARNARSRAIATVALGTAAFRRGNAGKARGLWNGIKTADPEVRTELAAAYSAASIDGKNPTAVCDRALAGFRKRGRPVPLDAAKNCIDVYARSGDFDKGFDLIETTDLNSYSYRESIGKSKVISFYDAALLSNLSTFYLRASLDALEKASAEGQLRGIAGFYLGEAYALAGDPARSAKATALFLSSPRIPTPYKNRALVRQGWVSHRKGRQTEAIGLWDDLMKKQPGEPELLADILGTCAELRIGCSKAARVSEAAVEQGRGRRFAVLNIGLGKYYLSRKDYGKAASFFESGRDKGNKNKIEYNDPVMLVGLSEAYYHTKKFSEALEIYFEMSKEFPEVRQIQEALQGIYSVEHKSAGDVKIY